VSCFVLWTIPLGFYVVLEFIGFRSLDFRIDKPKEFPFAIDEQHHADGSFDIDRLMGSTMGAQRSVSVPCGEMKYLGL
jgi:hypothetical protein